MTMQPLTTSQFLSLLEIDSSFFGTQCKEFIKSKNFNYRELDINEYQNCILENLTAIQLDNPDYSGSHRRNKWNLGWNENYELLLKSPKNLSLLKPLYYRPNHIIRFGDRYVYSESEEFEYNIFQLIRASVFDKFINNINFDKLFEFGCGPAHNLVYFYKQNPNLEYYGLDWAKSSQDIISLINQNLGSSIIGKKYDFFKPETDLPLDNSSVIITFGALEQTGDRWHNLLNYWLKSKPKLIINIEPISELYDLKFLTDYLGFMYHQKRKYLSGYYTYLKSLFDAKFIESLQVYKGSIGGRHMNGWNILVWKP